MTEPDDLEILEDSNSDASEIEKLVNEFFQEFDPENIEEKSDDEYENECRYQIFTLLEYVQTEVDLAIKRNE